MIYLVMSLMQGIGGPVLSTSRMHPGLTTEPQMQSPMHGIIRNNVLGGQATLPAGGLGHKCNCTGDSGICRVVEAEVICSGRIAGSKRHHPSGITSNSFN